MSRRKTGISKTSAQPATPLIGALLRLPHEIVVARLLTALHAKGFDVTTTELGLFLYPGPEGRRPIDLANQCGMTRQAMNYVLAGLERRGYVERQAGESAAVRVVHLTGKGRQLVAQIRSCVAGIEREWAAHLGPKRFEALRDTLYELAVWLGKLD